jgi:hypothetical protein
VGRAHDALGPSIELLPQKRERLERESKTGRLRIEVDKRPPSRDFDDPLTRYQRRVLVR